MWWTHFLHKNKRFGLRLINKTNHIHTSGVWKKGQVAIEATIAIVAIFIFLLGATEVFLWMNQNIIARQKAYQETRLELGNPERINFYQPTRLYVFPQEAPERR